MPKTVITNVTILFLVLFLKLSSLSVAWRRSGSILPTASVTFLLIPAISSLLAGQVLVTLATLLIHEDVLLLLVIPAGLPRVGHI